MTKKIITLLIWLLSAAALHLFGNNAGTFVVLVASVAVPVLSLAVLWIASGRTKSFFPALQIPCSCVKGEEVTGSFTLRHNRLLTAHCNLVCKNRFTGERESLQFAIRKGENKFTIQTTHCGILQIFIEEIIFHDPLGLFSRKIKTDAKQHTIIHPVGYAMDITLADNTFDPESSQHSTTKPGMDVSEIFAIREYTPGDPIRSIHWKLSEKVDKTMVREFSLPISNAALVFLENTLEKIPPMDWDAVGEKFFSTLLTLVENGAVVTAAWQNEDGSLSQFEIRDTDDALIAIGECFLTAMRYGAPARSLLSPDFISVMTITPM